MSGVRCDVWNWLLGPTLLCVGVAILFPSQNLEIILLYSLWALSTVSHIQYGTTVVSIKLFFVFIVIVVSFLYFNVKRFVICHVVTLFLYNELP